jgi:two-component system nitrogen regulation response regulator GlnG
LATADVLLPKDIPLGQVSASTDQYVNGSGGSVEGAIESLFNAASTDVSIELLPWLEREFTLRAMHKTNNNQVRAAKLLGITRATLRKRLERNGALGNGDDE